MADIKAGAPFGMDGAMVSKIDWYLALKRITPHLHIILHLRVLSGSGRPMRPNRWGRRSANSIAAGRGAVVVSAGERSQRITIGFTITGIDFAEGVLLFLS
jgi:hypothetical protein